jgi:glycogen operon protein
MTSWATIEGAPFPLGVTWCKAEQAYNFALYSKHAESVTLLFYRADDVVHPLCSFRLDYRPHKSWRSWHCRLPKASINDARYYTYVLTGPAPQGRFAWHHFDPQKLLLDPYVTSVFFPATFDRRAAMQLGRNDGQAPLGSLCACEDIFDWSGDARPRHASDLIIYELHVKGFTNHPNANVSPEKRGTYAGLIEKIPYLQELGVTAVELMPVFQYDPQEGNYWGYMPLNFFAPHQGYATKQAASACQQHHEFRAMVKALHQAGMEVILDVVYNHTGEGNHQGPVYSFKGIDNSTYYLMSDRPWDPYENFSGAGNTFHCANRSVRTMIVDSLRYWLTEMHVDGFRFDLASIFTRRTDGSINLDDPPIFSDMAADPTLRHVRVIAEPWDAAGAYQLGRGFPGSIAMQWNDRFRDDVRRFVRGDPGMVGALMSRLYGSDDVFPDDRMHASHAYQSLNYITSHDGFTLYDLVAYNEKRNWANGHHNTDGPQENYSWNCGWEGDDNVPSEVLRLRKRQIKNFLCLLLLANGTPMVRAGDEFMQTQGGNNNPYNQDNDTSWLDWDRWRANQDIVRFCKGMIAFRKAHRSLSRSRFWREDIRWYGVGPEVDTAYHSHSLAFCLHGASQQDSDLYVMINAYWEDVRFTIQEGEGGPWQRVIDTSLDSPDDVCALGAAVPLTSPTHVVNARAVVVLSRHQA